MGKDLNEAMIARGNLRLAEVKEDLHLTIEDLKITPGWQFLKRAFLRQRIFELSIEAIEELSRLLTLERQQREG